MPAPPSAIWQGRDPPQGARSPASSRDWSRSTLREVPERINAHTGQVTGGYEAVHVRRLAPLPVLLERIATAPAPATGKRNNHGGTRIPARMWGDGDRAHDHRSVQGLRGTDQADGAHHRRRRGRHPPTSR